MSTNTYIAICIGLMVNAVLFGIGVAAILSFPSIGGAWKFLIPAVVIVALGLTPFIARAIAPRLRLRHRDRRRHVSA